MKKLGLRLNAKKSVLSPIQRTTFLGVIWDSTSMQAHMSRIESILSAVKRIRQGQSLARLLGLMAAASNVIPFWAVAHETPAVVAQDQRVFPEGQPLSHDQGHVEGPSSLMAHRLSGDVGCISCSQEFPSRSQGPPCACPLREHIGGLLHKSPGGFAVTSTSQTGVPNPPVVPREVVVSASNLHP